MRKTFTNINRKRNVVIAVIIDNDNRVLLTKKHQPDSEFLHGKWQLPGLGIKLDETYDETLKRLQQTFAVVFEIQTTDPIESISYRNKNAYTLLHIFPCKMKRHPEMAATKIGSKTENFVIESPKQNNLHKDGHVVSLHAMTNNVSVNNTAWLSYKDLKPSDCTPLTMEIIEIARGD